MNETVRKILIVDDDPDITDTFSVGLEDTGLFEVETYNDSVEALSNFKPYLFDFILLDIKMPKMSGFELCNKMKKLDGNVKVCFISAFDPYSDDELKEEFRSRRMVECFIPKPIQINELVERIHVELSR
jgi:two-component system catabolic regulation response regulator CreB/two-component system response regulator ChvI